MKSLHSSLFLACAAATILTVLPAQAADKKTRTATPPPPNPAAAAANTLRTTITADQKEITDDRAALAKANKDLEDATNKLNADFDKTPDVVAAKKAVSDAAAEEQTARDAVMAKLADDPAHKAAVQKEADARKQLNDLRESNASQDAISAKAQEVFEAGGETSKIERDAENANPGYAAAQKKVEAANTALAALRTQFKDSLKSDASLTALRQARDEAQTKLNTAVAKLDTDRRGTSGAPAAAAGGY